MSTHKKIDIICCIAVIFALLVTVLFMNAEALGIQAADKVMGYEERLFDETKVHTVDIIIDDWDAFLATCQSEEYSVCNVLIDGEAYTNVGIRGKGNTSLSTVSSLGSSRYSFKIEFDQYDNTKNYYGLDKLCLNNIIQDNTYMKDFLAYQLMEEFGVDAPLCSYVYITVNGEDWGLYLAVEAIEDGFLQRNYGSDYGELYKPDSMSFGGGRGNGKDFDMGDFDFSQFENFGGGRQDSNQENSGANDDNSSENGSMQNPFGNMFGGGEMPDMSDMFGGEMPDMSDMFGGEMPDMGDMPQGGNFPGGNMQMPEGMEFPGGNMQMPEGMTIPEGMGGQDSTKNEEDASTDNKESSRDKSGSGRDFGNFGGGFGGFGMGSSDVKLQYIDDNASSYSNIFNSAKTDISEADEQRLIASLKDLSEGKNIESVVDIDEVIRYFVVHNFLVNGDSYTGSMIHNYYLYEKDGQLSMIPWDYNLAYGTFQGSNATGTVNDPIDSPVSGNMSDRPMVGWIFADEEYTEIYHQYFAEFIEKYYTNGELLELVNYTAELIAPYVEKDPTKFCTYEEFETGVEAMRKFCELRLESISGQLDGTIPSTSEGQSADNSNLVDASGLNISDLGTMNMGAGGFGGFGGNRGDRNEGSNRGGFSDMPGDIFGSEDEFSIQEGTERPDMENIQMPDNMEFSEGNMQRPDRSGEISNFENMGTVEDSSATTGVLLAASLVCLLVGLLAAYKYKR